MTPKEKLLDLIHEFGLCGYQINDLADYLLANGVVVLVDEPKNPPCWTCNHGWGSIGTDGCKSCEDSCEELTAYTLQLIEQEKAEAALKKME